MRSPVKLLIVRRKYFRDPSENLVRPLSPGCGKPLGADTRLPAGYGKAAAGTRTAFPSRRPSLWPSSSGVFGVAHASDEGGSSVRKAKPYQVSRPYIFVDVSILSKALNP